MKKLLTIYSDSHKKMFNDFFLSSFNKYLSNDYILLSKEIPQVCMTGKYNSSGFFEAMLKKIQWIIENFEINDNEEMVFADCDIQFFQSLKYSLNSDFLFQWDFNNYCAGFMIFKQSKKVLNFFKNIEKLVSLNLFNDQYAINILLNVSYDISKEKLPIDTYWSIGNFNKGRVWDKEEFLCNKKIIMHHANFTVGVNNKILMLEKMKTLQKKL